MEHNYWGFWGGSGSCNFFLNSGTRVGCNVRWKGADILDDESLLTDVSTYSTLIKMKLYTNQGNFQSLKLYAASNVAGVTLQVVERKHDGKYLEFPQTSLCQFMSKQDVQMVAFVLWNMKLHTEWDCLRTINLYYIAGAILVKQHSVHCILFLFVVDFSIIQYIYTPMAFASNEA